MPITSFTVNGVEVQPLLSTFEIRETINAVSTMVCDITSFGSPVERYNLFDPVVVEEDGTKIFAGTITQARERGFGGEPNLYDAITGAPELVSTITCEDYTRLGERVYVTETVAEGTLLKAFLTTVVTNYFSQFGVSLDASQVDGPALPEMTFDLVRANEVLKALTDATGFLWRIDYDLQLRMWEAGDLAAPFDVDEVNDPARWTGDVEVERILGDDYANRVVVVAGPLQEVNHVETFTGDGTTYSFPLEWTLTAMQYLVIVDGVPELLTFQGIGFDLAVQWLYFSSDNTIRRLTTGVPDPPANGAVISITFEGTFTAEVSAEDAGEIAAHGLYEYVERRTDVPSVEAAQALADAMLAERITAGDTIVRYETRWPAATLRAGQEQTINAPAARDIAGLHIITDMRIRAETPVSTVFTDDGLGLIRQITAKKSQLDHKWQYTYRDWLLRGQAGSGTSQGAGTPASVGPAPPVESIQYHHPDGGKFAGHSHLLFKQAYTTVTLGPDHTAAGANNLLGGEGHVVL